ncbi:hypothetical protein F5Y01DRAFT_322023 [Xylaria sp. FL0043]|nr:hypothetical protein F5Y01DRAFT_322023 [Xylaria sp. FL0043]
MANHERGGYDARQLKTPGKLLIGVETEVPLAIHALDRSTNESVLLGRAETLQALAKLFEEKGFFVYADAVDASRNHSYWGITEDASIDVWGQLKGRLKPLTDPYGSGTDLFNLDIGSPIEIKSPPMSIDTPDYEGAFRCMWDILRPYQIANVEYWKMASQHIHFSLLGSRDFPLDIAQKLAFCVVYFEKALDELNPTMTDTADQKRPGGWRNCDRFKKRNRVRPMENGRVPLNDLPSCWTSIRATRRLQDLSALMCYDDNIYRRLHVPPARSAEETLAWIAFTRMFIEAAEKMDQNKLDMAAERKISFLEALGFRLVGTREAQLRHEAEWAADPDNCEQTHRQLQQFMGCDIEFWSSILAVRDRMERDLAKLHSH